LGTPHTMNDQHRQSLMKAIETARRRLYWQATFALAIRFGLVCLPVGAALIAADQHWLNGQYTVGIALLVAYGAIVLPLTLAVFGRGTELDSALKIDQHAGLKDRVSSAWEFLTGQRALSEPHRLQIHDAVRRARTLSLGRMAWPAPGRRFWLLPAFAVLFVASFFVPPNAPVAVVDVAAAALHEDQLNLLKDLVEELELEETDDEMLEELVEKLKQVESQFEQGAVTDQDVMIELSRLDDRLRARMEQPGMDRLAEQLAELAPHLKASEAAEAVGDALMNEDEQQAAEEMEKLAQKVGKDGLSQQQREQLARNMSAASKKLSASSSDDGLSKDLDRGSKSLRNEDDDMFEQASKSIQKKMKQADKQREMEDLRKKIGMCKSNMGQQNAEFAMKRQGGGQKDGEQSDGLMAGRGTDRKESDPTRLDDSYKKLLQIKGMAGDGPVESQVEIAAGQTSPAQRGAREVHAEYTAVAEQALDRESVPLSHRYHVKRYFQAIRPGE